MAPWSLLLRYHCSSQGPEPLSSGANSSRPTNPMLCINIFDRENMGVITFVMLGDRRRRRAAIFRNTWLGCLGCMVFFGRSLACTRGTAVWYSCWTEEGEPEAPMPKRLLYILVYIPEGLEDSTGDKAFD